MQYGYNAVDFLSDFYNTHAHESEVCEFEYLNCFAVVAVIYAVPCNIEPRYSDIRITMTS